MKDAVRLFANVDHASQGTPSTIELIAEDGKPIPNYSGDQSARLHRNGTRTEVIWPTTESAEIAEIAIAEPFSIRVTFGDDSGAHIYAIYLEQD